MMGYQNGCALETTVAMTGACDNGSMKQVTHSFTPLLDGIRLSKGNAVP